MSELLVWIVLPLIPPLELVATAFVVLSLVRMNAGLSRLSIRRFISVYVALSRKPRLDGAVAVLLGDD